MGDSKNAIQNFGTEKRVMNEIVADAVDVGVDHQRVNKSENQHYPERRMRVKEEKSQEIREMK